MLRKYFYQQDYRQGLRDSELQGVIKILKNFSPLLPTIIKQLASCVLVYTTDQPNSPV